MKSHWFNRYLLPGLAFKAVVIGGGYATGRELVQFFFPSGPQGGLLAMMLTMVIWSTVCVVTFLFALTTQSLDYKAFFKNLLGPFWIAFEVAYALMMMLVLSVFGAAAGEISRAVFGWPPLAGTLALMVAIAGVAAFGNVAVERLFKVVSFFLYGVYAVFLVLAFSKFGDPIVARLAAPAPAPGWVLGGVTYAGYNLIGATVILPIVRHMTTRRDATIGGLLCGPLAILPAVLFFVCMLAFYPAIGRETLPSNFMLERLNAPVFHLVFQLMIFAALLESGTGMVHAVNQRVDSVYAGRGKRMPDWTRVTLTIGLLILSIMVATRFGLVDLIAKGYTASAYVFLAIFVTPLMTYGLWRLWKSGGLSLRREPAIELPRA